MDRFYFEKCLADLNRAVLEQLSQALSPHLTHAAALSLDVEPGETVYKDICFLIAVDQGCPASHWLNLHQQLKQTARRFSGLDTKCYLHLGGEDWAPPGDEDHTRMVLRFYLLEDHADHAYNRHLAACLVEDPDQLPAYLPAWLSFPQNPPWRWVEDSTMAFYQTHFTHQSMDIVDLRCVERAFWRVVNLACTYYRAKLYDDLVEHFPARFREACAAIPEAWRQIREREGQLTFDEWSRICRACFSFCRQLLDLEGN